MVFRDLIAPGTQGAARNSLLPVAFWSMLSFISILMVGYIYALKKGALDFKR